MAVEARLRVERTVISGDELVHGIVVDVLDSDVSLKWLALAQSGFFRDGSRETAEGQSHEDAVEPHLIGIDGLVPEHFVGHGSGLVLQLFHQCLHCLQVLLFRQLLVHASDKVAGADIVEVIVRQVVAAYFALFIDHGVGVELAVVHDFLVTVAQVGVKHAFQLDAHHIAPLGLARKVEHIALRCALHFTVGHPLRIVLIRLVKQGKTTVDEEIVETHIACLAAHEVTLFHTIEMTVLHIDVVDVSILVKSNDLYAVL